MSETLRFRADTSGKIYTTSGTPPSGTPSHGSAIAEWRDQETPATRDRSIVSSGGPLWQSPSPMALPAIQFDGADDFFSTLQVDSTSGASNTFLHSTSAALLNAAKSLIIACRIGAAATNNANIYDNTALITDTGGLFGIHFKTISGSHYIYAYNWDGTADVTPAIQVSLNTDYIVQCRHDGTTLSLSVLSGEGGANRVDQSVSSGSTSASNRNLRIGRVYSATATYFTGYIGEVYCDNNDIGATSSALTEVLSRWLPVTGPTYTLTAEVGAFAATGNAAALVASRLLSASAGLFAQAGEPTGLILGRRMTASSGSFLATGNEVELVVTRNSIDGTPGSRGCSVCVGMSL